MPPDIKGPSLEAIRKFKQEQERRKKLEDEKKIKDKLTTLEYRASQGDKKAKQELKKIETIREERIRAIELQKQQSNSKSQSRVGSSQSNNTPTLSKKPAPSKKVETDFDELMKLAKQNSNEIRKLPEQPAPKLEKKDKVKVVSSNGIEKKRDVDRKNKRETMSIVRDKQPQNCILANNKPVIPKPQSSIKRPLPTPPSQPSKPKQMQYTRVPITSSMQPSASYMNKSSNIVHHHQLDFRKRFRYDEDEYEDEYEEDDFVVDADEDDARDELRKTLKSVFRYDRRRCDLREEELDRQYRAIGRVTTFEDLEREERRASRLAAEEDSRAQREEEERKRLKKMRMRQKL